MRFVAHAASSMNINMLRDLHGRGFGTRTGHTISDYL